ncbi:glutamate synthase (ferredoxin) [Alicyclobacillus hesperidum URH17-3-68]|nr:glutamate synthase (ferredoxin) [Alicyclobacillus hesperidum URH17-3-68]
MNTDDPQNNTCTHQIDLIQMWLFQLNPLLPPAETYDEPSIWDGH